MKKMMMVLMVSVIVAGCYLEHDNVPDASINDASVECNSTEHQPELGINVFCPSDQQWIPELSRAWGVERDIAIQRCDRWVVCSPYSEHPWDACYHCLNSGTNMDRWQGIWTE